MNTEILIEKAKKNNVYEEGDYIGQDGLLYCGKCGEKKQTTITIIGEVKHPYCLCKCTIARRKKEDDDRKQLSDKLRIDHLRNVCFNYSKEMFKYTFENDDGKNPEIANYCKGYADHFAEMKAKGFGITLFGTCGTGKTFFSACIANALIDRKIPCLMTDFARIEANLRNGETGNKATQSYVDTLRQYDLLILDDFGTQRQTSYMSEIVFAVIDSRIKANLPFILTTNLTREQLLHQDEISEQRVFSRLLQKAKPIEVKGTDRRRNSLKQTYEEMSFIANGEEEKKSTIHSRDTR